jgi:hypothetical protein
MRFQKGGAWVLMAIEVTECRAMDSFAPHWFARRRKGNFSSAFVVDSTRKTNSRRGDGHCLRGRHSLV